LKFISKEKIMEKFDQPDVIIINIGSLTKQYPDYYKVPANSPFLDIIKLNDSVKINNTEYVQDSILLGNWNKNNNVGNVIFLVKNLNG
jgi:hypothetical protein